MTLWKFISKTKKFFWVCTTLIVLLIGGATNAVEAEQVDLEIVLAMDGSGSISETEYKLQLEGTAQAFEDHAIQAAITSGPNKKIAVAILIWSDAAFPKFKSKWYVLNGNQSANNFAHYIRNFHKHTGRKFGIGGGGTGIGEGIKVALNMITQNQYQGLRRIVDVSGDGIETDPWFKEAITLPQAKILARNKRIVVNGLPILNKDFPRLDLYYREEVIVGNESFIVIADGFKDFGRAIKKKLWKEIATPTT